MAALDPVTLAVLKGRLEQIADEMDATLFRSAFNPIIAEAHDASHGLYHAETGETLVQGKSGLPIFVGAMSFAVKAVIDKFGARGMINEGDVFIFNDPYEGGTHLSDFKLVQPFYRDGKLFCFLASVGHWHDVGGNVPGNYNPVATECFQEGMLIPPVKLYDRGEPRQDVIDILSANSRLPNSLYGDLNGQINALEQRDMVLVGHQDLAICPTDVGGQGITAPSGVDAAKHIPAQSRSGHRGQHVRGVAEQDAHMKWPGRVSHADQRRCLPRRDLEMFPPRPCVTVVFHSDPVVVGALPQQLLNRFHHRADPSSSASSVRSVST